MKLKTMERASQSAAAISFLFSEVLVVCESVSVVSPMIFMLAFKKLRHFYWVLKLSVWKV